MKYRVYERSIDKDGNTKLLQKWQRNDGERSGPGPRCSIRTVNGVFLKSIVGLSSYLGHGILQEGRGFEALRFELPQISGVSLSPNPNNDPQHSLLELSNPHDPLLFKLFWLQKDDAAQLHQFILHSREKMLLRTLRGLLVPSEFCSS
ncbi:hypothetical protein CFP56_031226 [Quercus suber]|uniref:Uncharacterized protein n=1 Tax=Quercus suber TaxID=58331 RepID=A0AAW0JME0_QUESU